MALAISTGFVVDDAIVVLENIMRYVEHGMDAVEAAFKGAAEIGFTVVSMSVLAGRSVHSAADDGRNCRTAVSGVRGHAEYCNRSFVVGLADHNADDVRQIPASISTGRGT